MPADPPIFPVTPNGLAAMKLTYEWTGILERKTKTVFRYEVEPGVWITRAHIKAAIDEAERDLARRLTGKGRE